MPNYQILRIMKKLIALIFLVSTVVPGFAQDVIEYDFAAKKFLIKKDNESKQRNVLKYNQDYQLQIINIDNRFNGNFVFNSSQFDFHESERDDNSFFRIIPKLEPKSATPDVDLAGKLQERIDEDSTFMKDKYGQNIPDDFMDLFKNDDNTEDDIENYIKGGLEKEKGKSVDKELRALIRKLKATQDSLVLVNKYNELMNSVNNVQEAFFAMAKLSEFNNSLVSLLKSKYVSKENIEKKLSDLENKYSDVYNTRSNLIMNFNNAHQDFLKLFNAINNDSKLSIIRNSFVEIDENIIASKTHVDNILDKVDSFYKEDDFKRMIDNIEQMIFKLRNETFIEIYFPDQIKPKKDQLTFKLNYKESSAGVNAFEYTVPQEIEYTFDVKGGIKITMSTGIMLSMGLYDREYSIGPVEEDTTMMAITEDNNHDIFRPTIGAMMHVLYRTSGSVTGGLAIGLGTDVTSLSALQIFAGGSLVLGRDERFILSGGFAASPVDYLNGKYELGRTYAKDQIDESDLTKETFRPGWFIGFSYNLTKIKTEETGD